MKIKTLCFIISAIIVTGISLNNTIKPANSYEGDDVIQIPINSHIYLSYKTRDEIFALRKKYVASSIFATPDYEPSEAVFGGIEDGKPWLSTNLCSEPPWVGEINGPSEHSINITNPSIPILLDLPFYLYKQESKSLCSATTYYFKPLSAYYSKEKKEITVTYPMLFATPSNSAFQFIGLNARDFGYNYMYLDSDKSTYKVKFVENNNVSNQVVALEDFIHVGGACGREGGCNNRSPMMPVLQFQTTSPYNYTENQAEFYIKLWKNEPSSYYDEPDLIERIIFVKRH